MIPKCTGIILAINESCCMNHITSNKLLGCKSIAEDVQLVILQVESAAECCLLSGYGCWKGEDSGMARNNAEMAGGG